MGQRFGLSITQCLNFTFHKNALVFSNNSLRLNAEVGQLTKQSVLSASHVQMWNKYSDLVLKQQYHSIKILYNISKGFAFTILLSCSPNYTIG